MHYLQLMYTYAPAWGFGGPSRLMYDYARWMIRSGVPVDVIAGDIHHDYTALPRGRTDVDGIPVRRVRVFLRRMVARAINLVSPAMFVLAVRKVWKTRGVTVLHIAELRSPVFLYAAILRRIARRRVLLVHSAFGMLHEKPSRIRRWFDPLFMGFMLRSVDIGLAQNDHESAAYRERCRRHGAYGTRIVLQPLHTPGPREGAGLAVSDETARMALRARYEVPAQAFVCIFLGRLHAEKGILRAIDAFEVFASTLDRPALFLVVGRDDGFQAEISRHVEEKGAAGRVRIVNNVYEDRFDYYTMADLFLGFPTIHEETMLSSVEALSCGTPALVSREADLPFVGAAEAGYVMDFSVEAAVERMRTIAASPALFRKRALALARDKFRQEAVCAALESALKNAVAERCRGTGAM